MNELRVTAPTKKPRGSGLIGTSLLGGVGTVVRVASAFLLIKLVALLTGPTGLGLVGQFGSFSAMVGAFAGGGINHGVTRYMAEYGEAGTAARFRLLQTAIAIAGVCSLALGSALVILRRHLSEWLFGTADFASILVIFAGTLVFFGLQGIFLAALNGAKEIRAMVGLQVAGSVVGLLIGGVLVVYFGLQGALVAVAIGPSAVFLLVLRSVRRRSWAPPILGPPRWDGKVSRRLAGYSVMALSTAVTLPLSHILIRNHLAREFSWEAAGYWQGIWQISEGYLMLITTTLGIYYLPRLAELKSVEEVREEILRGYRIVLPVCSLLALLIFILREPIVTVLFSADFLPMTGLFAVQLVGDVLKIASWLLSYIMVARAMTGLYVATEVAFSLSFVGLTFALTPGAGLVGVTYAFALAYLGYLLFLLWRFREYVFPTS